MRWPIASAPCTRCNGGQCSQGSARASSRWASEALSYWAWRAERRFRDERERAEQAQAASLEAAIRREAARVDIEGQLVAFAASPGQLAADGVQGEENSPYTKRLLEELADPNASVQTALSRASRKVLLLTNASQRPYLASDMNGDIYLRQQPPSRQCKAIVVAVDRAGKTTFANVARDGTAWAAFLATCGFEVDPSGQSDASAAARDDGASALRQRPGAADWDECPGPARWETEAEHLSVVLFFRRGQPGRSRSAALRVGHVD